MSVDKLMEEKNREGTIFSVQRSMSMWCTYILSTVNTENTCTPARLEALFKALSRHHSSVIHVRTIRTIQDSKPKLLRKRLCSQSIQSLFVLPNIVTQCV